MSESDSSSCGSGGSGAAARAGALLARSRLLALLAELEEAELREVEQWISGARYRDDLQRLKSYLKEDEKLKKIAAKIRKEIPFEGELPTEKILVPTAGSHVDCQKNNTCHIDEFLYDDEHVEKLVEKGKLSRHYCTSCGSRKTKELTFISHSVSREILLYIFKVLLPKDLSNQQILDVGSRLGAVLYGGYHLSNASSIVGIEINKELCQLQKKTISSFNLNTSRIKIINSDLIEQKTAFQKSNIVIINVFDFFVDTAKQIEMWNFMKSNIKRGSYLVTIRSIIDTLSGLGIYESFMDWLDPVSPQQPENEVFFNVEDIDYSDIYFYKVQ